MAEPEGGIWYEPRSLWAVGGASPQAGEVLSNLVLSREHFRNPGPYPIVFERLAIAAINYPFRVSPVGVTNYVPNGAGTEILNGQALFQWNAPQRQNYSRKSIVTATARPKPTSEPQPKGGAGSLYGQCRLNFKKPLYLPRTGSIETRLSSIQDFSFDDGGGRINVLGNASIDSLPATVAYLEAGGLFAGSARTKSMPVQVSRAAGGFNAIPQQNEDGWPWPLPPQLQNPTTPNGVPFWAPQSTFSATEFDRQEATRSGSTKILGMSVAIDQVEYDQAWLSTPFAGGPIVPGRVAPVSQSVGISARVTNGGGGGAHWWRPGAPIALVLDSITPAVVYELDEAVTLGPGDTFDMQVKIPGLAFEGGDRTLAERFTLGISLNGFAVIKG
jgi:hypothetical protein